MKILTWKEGDEKKIADLVSCKDCGCRLPGEWIDKGRRFCSRCYRKKKGLEEKPDQRISNEIKTFYFQTVQSLKSTVSHSRKGIPHKQSWGFHIENPYK